MNNKLFDFIFASPTPYHTVKTVADMLINEGFIRLNENEDWVLEKNKNYFVTRNMSSVIAFKVPEDFSSFMISAAHSDTPTFKVKENSLLKEGEYTKLSVEKYGGPILSTWLDRPLAVAGRVLVETENGIETKLFDTETPVCIIPTVAPHLDYNCEYSLNVDMIPMVSSGFKKEENVIASDLFLYNPQKGYQFGEYISAPRIDDLMCAFATLRAFIDAKNYKNMPVMCIFDNEEVGSGTKQGADSTFLDDVLNRIAQNFNKNLKTMIASSLLVSCDNGHAVHPNHPELTDKNHSSYMNKGVMIKYNANQKYTTDGISSAIFKKICKKAQIPYQEYCNRADKRGGGALGHISITHVSVNTIDIGLAQLSMHSIMETAGAEDTAYMVSAVKAFFETELKMIEDGKFNIK